jgi:hypothetical protein
MTRNPKRLAPGTSRNSGYAGPGTDLGDPPPAKVYPLKRGGRAVPDRSREPEIGSACGDTRAVVEGDVAAATPRFTDELRSGVELGTTRGNNEAVSKTSQEYGNAVTEARHGQATRPARPGDRA